MSERESPFLEEQSGATDFRPPGETGETPFADDPPARREFAPAADEPMEPAAWELFPDAPEGWPVDAWVDEVPPQPVRDALEAREEVLAVEIAVRLGMRDAGDLTDLVFHARHPERKGRRIKREETAAAKEWREIQATIVRPVLSGRRRTRSPKLGPVVCVRRALALAPPQPDRPPVDVTGRYELEVERADAERWTLTLNQAGRHLEGLAAPVLSGPVRAEKARLYRRVAGDLQQDGSFAMYSREDPDAWAILRPLKHGRLNLRTWDATGAGSDTVTRISSRPTVLPESFAALEAAGPPLGISPAELELLRRTEWAPLTGHLERHLRDNLAPAVVERFLKKFLDVEGHHLPQELARWEAASRFDYHLAAKVFSERFWHKRDLPVARDRARRMLASQLWTHDGIKRSYLDWLSIMLSIAATADIGEKERGRLEAMRTDLGLSVDSDPDAKRPQNLYEVTIDARGIGGGLIVKGGLFKGTATIRKRSPGGWANAERYPVWFAGAGAGLKAGVETGFEFRGEASSYHPWAPGDFPGSLWILDGDASASVLGVGVKGGATIVNLNGRGHFPPLTAFSTELAASVRPRKPKKKKKKKGKLSLGGGYEGMWGKLRSGRDYSLEDSSQIKLVSDYAVAYGLAEEIHFCLDSALLTPDGRQAIRLLCATELPAFMSSASRLAVVGHTDKSGSPEHNLKLSDLRARNVLQAIRDVLGDRLGIAESGIAKPIGMGESQATKEFNPAERRVDITLNARLVLRLRAQ